MKVNVEEISAVKKKVNVEIPEDLVKGEIDAFYKDLGKKAKIKGFRPGKVPRGILERYFKDYAKGEVTQKLIQDTYPKVFTEASLNPVSMPAIEPGELEPGKSFQYSATIEVKPDLKLEGYAGLKIEGKKEEATDEEVETRLKNLQNLHSNLKTISEVRPVQKGDYILLDYEGRMDGKSSEEDKAVDVAVEVGAGRFIPELEEKLAGLSPEEEKEIDVSFPEDYGYEKWAGKKISFHVKIKEIKEKILPALDDEFAKDLGDYASLDELKGKLKEDIAKSKETALERQLKDQIVDQLLQANSFEIPESLVEEQTKSLVAEMKMRLASQGMDIKNLGVTEEKLHEDYHPTAEKQVRTYLVLEKIADLEGLAVTDEEVEKRLQEISERSRQKFDAVKAYYEKNGLLPEVKAGIRGEKTLDLLLQKAEITYR
jgi:trigger factor